MKRSASVILVLLTTTLLACAADGKPLSSATTDPVPTTRVPSLTPSLAPTLTSAPSRERVVDCTSQSVSSAIEAAVGDGCVTSMTEALADRVFFGTADGYLGSEYNGAVTLWSPPDATGAVTGVQFQDASDSVTFIVDQGVGVFFPDEGETFLNLEAGGMDNIGKDRDPTKIGVHGYYWMPKVLISVEEDPYRDSGYRGVSEAGELVTLGLGGKNCVWLEGGMLEYPGALPLHWYKDLSDVFPQAFFRKERCP